MILDDVKSVLAQTLQIPEKMKRYDASTELFGSIPEFDSMAVISVVSALEDKFGITVDDEDITADTFKTIGSLSDFVQRKLGK